MFLLDTNIVSEIVRRVPDANVTARLSQEPAAGLHLSSVSVFELRYGAARSAKPASLWARIQRDILSRFQVLPFTEQDALTAADLMAPLIKSGQQFSLQDIWLAGVAYGRDLTLVTRNRRDFDRVPGLKLENWFE